MLWKVFRPDSYRFRVQTRTRYVCVLGSLQRRFIDYYLLRYDYYYSPRAPSSGDTRAPPEPFRSLPSSSDSVTPMIAEVNGRRVTLCSFHAPTIVSNYMLVDERPSNDSLISGHAHE